MLEIACFEMTSAEIAMQSVADRIEFCSEIEFGGLTPNFEEFCYLKSKYDKPIYVMIRPKGGEFLYTDAEFELMKQDIIRFKQAGAAGFVFGILTPTNEIDIEKNSELISLANGLPCTFHRAIDRTDDVINNVKKIAELGFNTVLTSGGTSSAEEGMVCIKNLIKENSDKINILIGGGIRSTNIATIKEFTKGTFFHSSAIPKYEMYANEDEIKKLKNLMS